MLLQCFDKTKRKTMKKKRAKKRNPNSYLKDQRLKSINPLNKDWAWTSPCILETLAS